MAVARAKLRVVPRAAQVVEAVVAVVAATVVALVSSVERADSSLV